MTVRHLQVSSTYLYWYTLTTWCASFVRQHTMATAAGIALSANRSHSMLSCRVVSMSAQTTACTMCFAAKQGDAVPMKHSLAYLAGLQLHCKVGQTASRLPGTNAICERGLSVHSRWPLRRPRPHAQSTCCRCLSVSDRLDKLCTLRAEIRG